MIKPIILSSGQKIYVHRAIQCAGDTCCIHNPSDHHMRDWKQWWVDELKLMQRVCPHGIGHPDPDHVAFVLRQLRLAIDPPHGCDGCCRPPFIVDGEVVEECNTDNPKLLTPSMEASNPGSLTPSSER